jgi:single-strand DNA-binding protein
MTIGLNKAMLIGEVDSDPDLRSTPNGRSKLSMRLKTTETYVDQNKQNREVSHWHTVVLWGTRAEGLKKILTKGSRVYVEGRIESRNYDDKDGVKKHVTDIVASNLIVLDASSSSSSHGRPTGAASAPVRSASPPVRHDHHDDPPDDVSVGGNDDDIPF